MAKRTLPGIGLTGYWDTGAAYKDEMDVNLRLLSVLVQGHFLDSVATEPGSPADGQVYRATGVWGGGAEHDILVRDNGAWVAITPAEGWSFYDRAADQQLRFSGTTWGIVTSGGSGNALTVGSAITASGNTDNADFVGNVTRAVNSASDVTLTVQSGNPNVGAVNYFRQGAGEVAFAAGSGVTILSAGGNLRIDLQNQSVVLIHLGSDTYRLEGPLKT